MNHFLSQMKTEVLLLTNPRCFFPSYEKRRSQGGQLCCFTVEPSCSSPVCAVTFHPSTLHGNGWWQSDNTQQKSHSELCGTGGDGGLTAGAEVPKTATVIAALCPQQGLKTEILGPVSKISCWTKIAQLYKSKKNLKTTTKKMPKWCQM